MASDRITRYNLFWPWSQSDLEIEMDCYVQGGRWRKANGQMAGEGLEFHFKKAISILWPEINWNHWSNMQIRLYLQYRIIGQMGPASCGKTFLPSACVLMDYYCFPNCTTVLVSSTTRESLEMRVLGEIKKLHRAAKGRYWWIPGNLIEGRQRIVTDDRSIAAEGRDFRNGLVGVAVKKGQTFQGMEEYCFPSGTLVDTPSGPRDIAVIEPGDVVFNAFGAAKVKDSVHRQASTLVRVWLACGKSVDCTPEHRFLTSMGWKNAIDLLHNDRLISTHESMRGVRKGIREEWQEVLFMEVQPGIGNEGLQILPRDVSPQGQKVPFLFPPLFGSIQLRTWGAGQGQGEHRLRRNGSEDQCRDHGQAGHQESGCGSNQEADQRPAVGTYREVLDHQALFESEGFWTSRQRNRTNSIRGSFVVAVPGGQIRTDHINQSRREVIQKQNRNPALLPTRSRLASNQAGSGGGRREPLEAFADSEGQEEGIDPGHFRVDRVEILERSGDERYHEGQGGYRVHNLEVEGHPSYSVNGLVVHNCGIKNKRLRMLGDEMQFLPRSCVDAISNLNKNPDFKGVFSGNPKDVTDALGAICEPAAHLGGWDGGIDQSGVSKSWETRFPHGCCIQFVGTDSPNLGGNLGIPLITQAQIDEDIAFYGQDSLQFSMMDLGRMPRGAASRRVITRQMCLKFLAMEEPVWDDEKRLKIGFLDAAYRGVGGDRCVFGELEMGMEHKPADAGELASAVVSQKPVKREGTQLLALINTMVVPVRVDLNEQPEDQIAMFVKSHCETRGILPENFFFDSTGRGSLMNSFGRLWSPNVVGIEFGGNPTENRKVSYQLDIQCKEYYFNFVSELWFNVAYTIQSGQFRGLTEDVMAEGCMREWGWASKKIQVEPKEKMKLKSGRSPDLFDALVCGVEGARRRGFVIKRTEAAGHKKVDRTWKTNLKQRAQEHWSGGQLNYAA
jgi:hypothetical protein